MKSASKQIANCAAKSGTKGQSSTCVTRSSSGQFVSDGKDMTSPQLHRAIVDYRREIAASCQTAVAFLNRIGAPVKATKR